MEDMSSISDKLVDQELQYIDSFTSSTSRFFDDVFFAHFAQTNPQTRSLVVKEEEADLIFYPLHSIPSLFSLPYSDEQYVFVRLPLNTGAEEVVELVDGSEVVEKEDNVYVPYSQVQHLVEDGSLILT